jgi:Zn ribbon nucleic-acid-binding protein
LAELNGSYGRCPRCHGRIWVESGCLAECDHCGWDERENEGDEKEYVRRQIQQTLADVGMCEDDFR